MQNGYRCNAAPTPTNAARLQVHCSIADPTKVARLQVHCSPPLKQKVTGALQPPPHKSSNLRGALQPPPPLMQQAYRCTAASLDLLHTCSYPLSHLHNSNIILKGFCVIGQLKWLCDSIETMMCSPGSIISAEELSP